MDDSLGSKLIHELLTDSAKFNEEGRSYQLLKEYFDEFPLETLRPLLSNNDPLVRRAAVWIVSELGEEGHKARISFFCEQVSLCLT